MGVKGQKPTNAPRWGDLRGAAWIRCASPRWARRADSKCILHAHMGKDLTSRGTRRRQGEEFCSGRCGWLWAALGCAGLGCYWRLLITDRCHRALSLRRDSPIRAARALCRAWQGGLGRESSARRGHQGQFSDPILAVTTVQGHGAVLYRTVPYAH
jgi:hypothetical protein